MRQLARLSGLPALLLGALLALNGCAGGPGSISVATVASDIIFGAVPVAKPATKAVPPQQVNFNLSFNSLGGFFQSPLLTTGDCPSALATAAVQQYSTTDITRPPSEGSYRWLSTIKSANAAGVSKTTSGFSARDLEHVYNVRTTTSQSQATRQILHYTYDLSEATADGGKVVTSYVVNTWSDEDWQDGTGQPQVPGDFPDPDGGLALHSVVTYDAGGNVTSTFKPSSDLLLMPLPVQATGTAPNAANATTPFTPGWVFSGRDPNTGDAVQVAGEISSTKPRTIGACGTLLDGFQVYRQLASAHCGAAQTTSACLGTPTATSVPGTNAPCPANVACDEYDLVVDTGDGLGGLIVSSELSGSDGTGGSVDDKEQAASGLPGAAASVCPSAPDRAPIVDPSGKDVPVSAGKSPIQSGGYRWLTQVQLSDPTGATNDSGGLETQRVQNVSPVTESAGNLQSTIDHYTYDTVQPTSDGGKVVTSYVVNTDSDINSNSPQPADPDGGLALHAIVRYDKSGKVVESFQPATDLLLLILPVQAEGSAPVGQVPAEPGYSFIGQDPSNGTTMQMNVEVYTGHEPLVDACGTLTNGWQVYSQVKTAKCPTTETPQQCIATSSAPTDEYDFVVSTALGALIIQSELSGPSSVGAGWTVDDFEHVASLKVSP